MISLVLVVTFAVDPYTMLTCAESNACGDYCTTRSQSRFPNGARWGACPTSADPCNAAKIECSSLDYIAIDDVVAQYGSRAAATTEEKSGRTALIVSVQDAVVTGGGGGEVQKQLEWLHVLSQGVSNVAHWLGPPEGWQGLRSMEWMTGDRMHLTMDDHALLASSLPASAAAAHGLHVNSWTKQYESSPMPPGLPPTQIGNLVVQLVDPALKASIVAGNNAFCDALNALYPPAGGGLADNYDYIFFVVTGTQQYTSTHMNVHQSAIPGTGTGATALSGCGGSRVKGATLLQPLSQGSMGPFYHEWFHQYAAHMSLLHTQLGADSGGHWGWTAFPDHRGVLGGFNYMYCANADASLSTQRFNMAVSATGITPAQECDPARAASSTAAVYISVDESEANLDSPPLPAGYPAGRWGKLGDPAGRPDYLYTWPFNQFELYVLGLQTIAEMGGGAASSPTTSVPTQAPTKAPAAPMTAVPSAAPTSGPTRAPLTASPVSSGSVAPTAAPVAPAPGATTSQHPSASPTIDARDAPGGAAQDAAEAQAAAEEATTALLIVVGVVGALALCCCAGLIALLVLLAAGKHKKGSDDERTSMASADGIAMTTGRVVRVKAAARAQGRDSVDTNEGSRRLSDGRALPAGWRRHFDDKEGLSYFTDAAGARPATWTKPEADEFQLIELNFDDVKVNLFFISFVCSLFFCLLLFFCWPPFVSILS